MKKYIISIFFTFLLIIIFNSDDVLATDFSNNSVQKDIITFEELQELFPDIPLRNDGYIENAVSYSDNGKEKNIGYLPSIVETFSAISDSGECNLNIYSDGSYGIYGYELDDKIQTLNSGYETNGSYCTSYYKAGLYGFSYKFKITNLPIGYSTLSEKPIGISPYSIGGVLYFEAGAVKYVRETQTSSHPAEITGVGTLKTIDGNVKCGVHTLRTKVNRGTITVSLEVM